jgi:hypothetical protein
MGICFSRMGIEIYKLGMWILRDGLAQVEPRRSVNHVCNSPFVGDCVGTQFSSAHDQ